MAVLLLGPAIFVVVGLPRWSAVDFTGVGLKIQRAQRASADLKMAMKAALGPDRYVMDSERQGQTGKYVYRVREIPPLDPGWSLIVGEILFNLRSALDHFAWQLASHDGEGIPGKHTQFPIRDTPFNDKGQLLPAEIVPRLKDPKLRAAVEEVQPYQGMFGDRINLHPLQRLFVLNNWDKHRLLLLAVQVLDLGRVYWAGNDDDPTPGWAFSSQPLKDGADVALFDFGGAERPMNFHPNLALTVAIEEPLNMEGSAVRFVKLDDLLTELFWGVANFTLADKFWPLLPASATLQLFPGMGSCD